MSTSDENNVDAQEIPLEQLSEVAGGAGDGNTHGGLSTGDTPVGRRGDRGADRR